MATYFQVDPRSTGPSCRGSHLPTSSATVSTSARGRTPAALPGRLPRIGNLVESGRHFQAGAEDDMISTDFVQRKDK